MKFETLSSQGSYAVGPVNFHNICEADKDFITSALT